MARRRPASVQVDWVNQSVIFFNYNDFKLACPYRDFEFALRRVCTAGHRVQLRYLRRPVASSLMGPPLTAFGPVRGRRHTTPSPLSTCLPARLAVGCALFVLLLQRRGGRRAQVHRPGAVRAEGAAPGAGQRPAAPGGAHHGPPAGGGAPHPPARHQEHGGGQAAGRARQRHPRQRSAAPRAAPGLRLRKVLLPVRGEGACWTGRRREGHAVPRYAGPEARAATLHRPTRQPFSSCPLLFHRR